MLNFELRWAATASRCILPQGSLGGTTDDKDLFALYEADCALAPWNANMVLRLSIWMTWFAPLWMEGRFKTFGGLSESERVLVMEKLLGSLPVEWIRKITHQNAAKLYRHPLPAVCKP